MNTQQTCPKCGKSIPDDAPQGLCPQCLLVTGQDSATNASSVADSTTVREELDPSETGRPSSSGGSRARILGEVPAGVGTRIRYLGDYELVDEIARGGMGVVYRARQVSLNRTVAVKMILSGQFASEADVARFRSEAEAAANLQHPNIVAIHEVGEHDGQHYFSMDYVAGPNLAQATHASPMPGEQAARLVKAMAEAIQYAHQRGVLHRDLKPQNVLMDERGQPRITDFGLAKRVEEDRGLTRSGAVMGSPGYMAPEQAAGHSGQVGVASDVYGLGAVLYYLLTGKAPFQGATAAETIQKVAEGGVVAPTRWSPGTPRDLETICLKCLEKSPERRYSTARQLAEELERYLNREPILARRASAVRRGWNWLQRHPWVITGVGSLLLLGLACASFGFWERTRYLAWKSAHPGEFPVIGFEPLLLTYLPFCLLLFGWGRQARKAFRAHYDRQRREGVPVPGDVRALYGAIGLTSLAYSGCLILKLIELVAWQHALLWPFGLPILLLLWSGAHDLWQAVGSHESSTFHEAVQVRVDRAIQLDREGRSTPLVQFYKLAVIGAAGFFSVFFIGFVFPFQLFRHSAGEQVDLQGLVGAFIGWLLSWLPLLPIGHTADVRRSVNRRLVVAWCIWLALSAGTLLFKPDVAPGVFAGGLIGFGLALALAFIRTDRQPERAPDLPASAGRLARSGLARFARNPEVIAVLVVAVGFLAFAFSTGVAKWRVEADERELAAQQGQGIPRGLHRAPAVPDELNFAQTPLLRSIAYFHRGDKAALVKLQAYRGAVGLAGSTSFRVGQRLDLGMLLLAPTPAAQPLAKPDNRASQAAAVEEAMRAFEPELAELGQASTRPATRFDGPEVEFGLFATDRNALNLTALRLVMGICAGHASAEITLKHPERAMVDLRIAHQMSLAVAERVLDFAGVVGAAMRPALVQVVWEGLLDHVWSDEQLAEFIRWFEAYDGVQGLDLAITDELVWVNRYVDNQASMLQIFPFSMMFQDQLLFNRLTREYRQAAYNVRRQAVYPRRLQRVESSASSALPRTRPLPGLPRDWFPQVWSLIYNGAARVADTRLAEVACGLERHRLARGEYPARLEELTPRFLARLPRDVIDGQPLHYLRGSSPGESFVLYSVGWDEKDDGGRPVAEFKETASGDWVWRTVEVKPSP